MDSFNGPIRDLVDAALSSLWDPDPVKLPAPDGRRLRPLLRLLGDGIEDCQELTRPLSRNAFLYGCLTHTSMAQIEHLIVGYGTKQGTGTRITSIQHTTGGADSVTVTPLMQRMLQFHSTQVPRSEAVVFHNHPRSWLNLIFDNVPLASVQDRALLLRQRYVEPLQTLRWLMQKGGARFYVGENGYVREYNAPPILRLLDLSARTQTRNVGL